MASLQKDLSNRPASSQSNQLLLPDVNPCTLPTPPAAPPGAPPPAAVQVLREAKKILGFSPIRRDDIDYLKMQNSIEDDSQAMISSILEFLSYQMKVPQSITDNLVIRRFSLLLNPPLKVGLLCMQSSNTSPPLSLSSNMSGIFFMAKQYQSMFLTAFIQDTLPGM